ncbi:2276_t:CDS:2, partial [Cetraspora pellucida]
PNELYIPKPIVPHPGPPPSDLNGNSHARIVVEVANYQSTESWITKCELWLQETYVRYVFGIKLHKPRNIRDFQGRRLRAMTARLWTQGTAGYQEWDFGTIPKGTIIYPGHTILTTACTGLGLPNFTVSIPVREVFYGPPNPVPPGYSPVIPAGLTINPGASFNIDLYDIQQEILRVQIN